MAQRLATNAELSDVVADAVQSVPKKHKVCQASKVAIVPLSFAPNVVAEQLQGSTLKTFIDIKKPTSMHSEDGSAPRTASTTEADPRKKTVVYRPCMW